MGTNLCIVLGMGLLPTTRNEGQELLRDRSHVRKKDSRKAVQELRSRGGCGRTVETRAGYCTILKGSNKKQNDTPGHIFRICMNYGYIRYQSPCARRSLVSRKISQIDHNSCLISLISTLGPPYFMINVYRPLFFSSDPSLSRSRNLAMTAYL